MLARVGALVRNISRVGVCKSEGMNGSGRLWVIEESVCGSNGRAGDKGKVIDMGLDASG